MQIPRLHIGNSAKRYLLDIAIQSLKYFTEVFIFPELFSHLKKHFKTSAVVFSPLANNPRVKGSRGTDYRTNSGEGFVIAHVIS